MPKTILITGANGNLGTAVVKKFLDGGYRVIATDHSDSHLGFAKGHPAFHWGAVDLTNEQATADFIGGLIREYGTIEGALLLVGGFAMGGIDATGEAELAKMFTLNFNTAYFAARPLFRHMEERGYGRIVLIGARPAIRAEQGRHVMAYALSKSLLFTLADLLNATAKGSNVVVSIVAPSTIDTPVNRSSMPDADPDNWVKPDQLADVLEFICSDKGMALREPVFKVYGNS